MMTPQQELDAFYGFASQRLAEGPADVSLSELWDLWQLEAPDVEETKEVAAALAFSRLCQELGLKLLAEREQIHVALTEALADIDVGRLESAHQVMAQLRERYNIPSGQDPDPRSSDDLTAGARGEADLTAGAPDETAAPPLRAAPMDR